METILLVEDDAALSEGIALAFSRSPMSLFAAPRWPRPGGHYRRGCSP